MGSVKTKRLALAFLLFAGVLSCGESNRPGNTAPGTGRDPAQYNPRLAQAVMDLIIWNNSAMADSVSASLDITGTVRNDRFRMTGQFLFDRKARAMNLFLIDFIFKSPVASIYQDGKLFSFFLPMERKAYVFGQSQPSLGRFVALEADFSVVYGIVTGIIPLIDNARIRGCVHCEKETDRFIILENDRFYQTIHLANRHPDRMLLVNRSTGNRFECYYKNYIRNLDFYFPDHIRIVDRNSGLDVTIRLFGVTLQKAVTLQKFQPPKNVTVIQL